MVHAAFLLAADNVVLAADKMKLLSHGFAQTASLQVPSALALPRQAGKVWGYCLPMLDNRYSGPGYVGLTKNVHSAPSLLQQMPL